MIYLICEVCDTTVFWNTAIMCITNMQIAVYVLQLSIEMLTHISTSHFAAFVGLWPLGVMMKSKDLIT